MCGICQRIKTDAGNDAHVRKVSCAAAGIIVGIVNLTGLGVKFSSSLIALSHGNILMALFLTMIASIILGCGLPTTAVYIILASLAAPALIQMGVAPLAAHLFVFYFGCISTITPPVALTSYAASGIGDANPTKTGFKAFIYGIVAYIVPYMFVLSPALLLQESFLPSIYGIFTALVGIYELSTGVSGYMRTHLIAPLRVLLIIGGAMLIKYGVVTDIIGVSIFIIVFIIQTLKLRKESDNAAKGGTDQYASGTPARKQQTNLRPCGREKRVSLLGSKPYR